MGIKEKEAVIITQFEHLEEWLDKYNLIIELGKEMQGLNEEFKTENRLIKGCQSQVWLHAEYKDKKIYFTADSDAIITKGIASLLIKVLSEETADDILNTELEFIEHIGLKSHLSPNRANGLVSMIKQMKLYAMAFKAKEISNKA